MIRTIANIKPKEIIKGFRGRFIHAQTFTLAFWEIDAGSELPEHSHIHEQTTQVVSGRLQLTIDGKTYNCSAGDVLVIPPNAVHSGKAITDCNLIDTFCPVRTDYK